jgi:hypothetical protein
MLQGLVSFHINGHVTFWIEVIPLQAYGAQRVLGSLRLPDSVISALENGTFSAIRTGRIYPQEFTFWIRTSTNTADGMLG